ncbi:lipase [Leptothoe sp. EHU-05/26/07-4]
MTTTDTSGYNNGTYSFEQQIFCISWSTILSFNYTGEAAAIAKQTKAMLTKVLQDEEIQTLIGVWHLVWGPGVSVGSWAGPGRAVNTMFIIVPQTDPSQAVIAIAGTNGKSLMNWVLQDFNVRETVPWPYGKKSNVASIACYLGPHWCGPQREPRISKGISLGLKNLVSIKSPQDHGTTAQQYLASRPFKNIMVTGHSLGGALSPCYSLYLEDTRSEWDTDGSTSISCLPTAGQTQGDTNFSKYYDSKLLATTNRQWNSMDMVPHAFNSEMLDKIPKLYKQCDLQSTPLVDLLVFLLKQSTRKNNYLNVAPNTKGFESTCYDYDINNMRSQYPATSDEIDQVVNELKKDLDLSETNKNHTNTINFLTEALIQHSIGYIEYFDIGDFAQRMDAISQRTVTVMARPTEAGVRIQTVLASLNTTPILMMELGQRSKDKIDDLKEGEGPLLDEILERVSQWNDGTPMENSQPLIFLIEEGW